MQTANRNRKLVWLFALFVASFQALARPIHYVTGCSAQGKCCVAVNAADFTSCCGHACGVAHPKSTWSTDGRHLEKADRARDLQDEHQVRAPSGEHACSVCEQLSKQVHSTSIDKIELSSPESSELSILPLNPFLDSAPSTHQARAPPR
jgi:hypothetical protein